MTCHVSKHTGCTQEEIAFIDLTLKQFGQDSRGMLAEAQRLKSKRFDVMPRHRPWIVARMNILRELAHEQGRRKRSEEL